MEWFELFPKDTQPTKENILAFLGEAGELWESLTSYIETIYKTKDHLQRLRRYARLEPKAA